MRYSRLPAGTLQPAAGARPRWTWKVTVPASANPGQDPITVQAVTLPSGGTLPAAGGRITGVHLFALGIGPLTAKGVPLSGDDS